MTPGVGLLLAPEHAWLDRLDRAIAEDVDYYSVTPETLWALDRSGALVPNSYHGRFAELRARTGRAFVAHSVGMSLGGVHPSEEERRCALLDRMRIDHAIFDFAWWTDHLGTVGLAGQYVALPLPVPHTRAAAGVVRGVLESMREIVPNVGFENSALYFAPPAVDPLAEPSFIDACLEERGSSLLLDLHNVCTSARNLGFSTEDWLDRVDLSRVIEIHVAGGSDSPPDWLPSGRSLRLDSHDDAVPDEVWDLLRRVVPRCPRLRGVTLERLEGTVEAPDVPLVREELRRIREILSWSRERPQAHATRRTCERLPEGDRDALRDHEADLAVRLQRDHEGVDGIALASLLVARLRFERLLAGDPLAADHYERDPAAFVETFRHYTASTEAAWHPAEEGARFATWLASAGA